MYTGAQIHYPFAVESEWPLPMANTIQSFRVFQMWTALDCDQCGATGRCTYPVGPSNSTARPVSCLCQHVTNLCVKKEGPIVEIIGIVGTLHTACAVYRMQYRPILHVFVSLVKNLYIFLGLYRILHYAYYTQYAV